MEGGRGRINGRASLEGEDEQSQHSDKPRPNWPVGSRLRAALSLPYSRTHDHTAAESSRIVVVQVDGLNRWSAVVAVAIG